MKDISELWFEHKVGDLLLDKNNVGQICMIVSINPRTDIYTIFLFPCDKYKFSAFEDYRKESVGIWFDRFE